MPPSLLPPQPLLPVLETPRLVLRPMEMADAPDVFAYAADPAVLRHTTGVTPTRVGETEAFLRAVLADPETHMWAVRLRGAPRVIGAIEFGIAPDGTGSVHYALGRAYWGRGLMPEAVEAVCAWGFGAVPTLRAIVTAVAEANPASMRVLEKCGFARVDTVSEAWEKASAPVRLVVFRRERGAARSAPAGGARP